MEYYYDTFLGMIVYLYSTICDILMFTHTHADNAQRNFIEILLVVLNL